METTKTVGQDLGEIIGERIAALILEMEAADWRTEDVVLAIDAAIKNAWMPRLQALRQARSATPANFVSDGNEG